MKLIVIKENKKKIHEKKQEKLRWLPTMACHEMLHTAHKTLSLTYATFLSPPRRAPPPRHPDTRPGKHHHSQPGKIYPPTVPSMNHCPMATHPARHPPVCYPTTPRAPQPVTQPVSRLSPSHLVHLAKVPPASDWSWLTGAKNGKKNRHYSAKKHTRANKTPFLLLLGF